MIAAILLAYAAGALSGAGALILWALCAASRRL